MRNNPKAWTLGIAGITLIVALMLFLGPQSRDRSVAATNATPAPNAPATTPPQHRTIVPADVLGTGAPWAPATGDGSN